MLLPVQIDIGYDQITSLLEDDEAAGLILHMQERQRQYPLTWSADEPLPYPRVGADGISEPYYADIPGTDLSFRLCPKHPGHVIIFDPHHGTYELEMAGTEYVIVAQGLRVKPAEDGLLVSRLVPLEQKVPCEFKLD